MADGETTESKTKSSSNLMHAIYSGFTLLVAGGITYAILFEGVDWTLISLSFVFPIIIALLNSISQGDPFDLLAVIQFVAFIAGTAIVFYVSLKGDGMPEKISGAAMAIGSLLTGVGLGGLPRFANLRK